MYYLHIYNLEIFIHILYKKRFEEQCYNVQIGVFVRHLGTTPGDI